MSKDTRFHEIVNVFAFVCEQIKNEALRENMNSAETVQIKKC